jgi:hypothetical protein
LRHILTSRLGNHSPKLGSMDKLQRADRYFLLGLIARHGLAGAARVLRPLADELEQLAAAPGDEIRI